MRSIILSICLPLYLAGVLLAQPAWPADRPMVLVLGDSLSAAYGMQQAESWPRLLEDRLLQRGYNYVVFNSSITGDTTEGGWVRLKRLLEKHTPAVLIIELGGNDGLRGLALEVTRENLTRMIEAGKAVGAAVVLAGIQLPPNYGPEYTRRFGAMYAELAAAHEIALVPFILDGVALDPELMQEDGIHPNAAAQPLILDNVWTALEPVLPPADPGQPG